MNAQAITRLKIEYMVQIQRIFHKILSSLSGRFFWLAHVFRMIHTLLSHHAMLQVSIMDWEKLLRGKQLNWHPGIRMCVPNLGEMDAYALHGWGTKDLKRLAGDIGGEVSKLRTVEMVLSLSPKSE